MANFPKSLIEVVAEYLRLAALSSLELPKELKDELSQIIVNSQVLNGYDSPGKTLASMMSGLDFTFRNQHPEARGEVRLKKSSRAFKEFDWQVTNWIRATTFSDLSSLVPSCLFVETPGAFAEPVNIKCASGESINVSSVKNAVIVFVRQSETAKSQISLNRVSSPRQTCLIVRAAVG